MTRALPTVAIFLFTGLLFAQDASELESRYTKLDAYAVRADIVLLVKYASDGHVCEMAFEPRHWTGEKMVVDPALSKDVVLKLVEEIVPQAERGERRKEFPNDSIVVHGVTFTSIVTYERLKVDFGGSSKNLGSPTIALVTWPDRPCV